MIGKIILYFLICILVTAGLQRLTPDFGLLYLVVCLAALVVGGVAIVLGHRDQAAREELQTLKEGGPPPSNRR